MRWYTSCYRDSAVDRRSSIGRSVGDVVDGRTTGPARFTCWINRTARRGGMAEDREGSSAEAVAMVPG